MIPLPNNRFNYKVLCVPNCHAMTTEKKTGPYILPSAPEGGQWPVSLPSVHAVSLSHTCTRVHPPSLPHTHQTTNKSTTWSRVLSANYYLQSIQTNTQHSPVSKLVKIVQKLVIFYGTWWFITVFTRAYPLSCAEPHTTCQHPPILSFKLYFKVLSLHLDLGK